MQQKTGIAWFIVAVLLVGPVTAAWADEPVWPLQNGSHDILHSFQHPFQFAGFYFHEGVDIRGNLDEVVAVRSGMVKYVAPLDSGGTLGVLVETADGEEFDSYLHINVGAWNVNDPIAAGDVVGTVSNSYFTGEIKHHVHVNRFDGWAGGNGYVTGRTNMLHPLAIFSDPADRDPQQIAAGPEDADEDGVIFRVINAASNSQNRPFPWGDVDLLIENTDPQTTTLDFNQGLVGIGYWIESFAPNGADVRDAEMPYVLLKFDDAWRSSHSNCDTLVSGVMDTSRAVDFGDTDTGWPSLANYKVTNTKGTTGGGNNVDAGQFWRTDARVNTGDRPNGSNSLPARDINEATFRDGLYQVHCLTSDQEHNVDTTYPVIVDNFRPYVKRVMIHSGEGELVYDARWKWYPLQEKLKIIPQNLDAATVHASPTQDLTIEVIFSEPVATAAITAIVPPVISLPVLASDQPENDRVIWTATIPESDLDDAGGHNGMHTIKIQCSDLNGNAGFKSNTTDPRSAYFNKRTGDDVLGGTPGKDIIHRFRIGVFGDVDHNLIVDGEDVVGMVAQLMQSAPYDPNADHNADGVVDEVDIAPFVEQALNGG